MINKRWITLPVVYSRSFASKAVFWAILKEFWFAKNRITPLSNFVARRSKDSPSYLLIENPPKQPRASGKRKLESHSIEWQGCVARFIHVRASHKPSCWLPIFWLDVVNQMVEYNNWWKEDLVSVYYLVTSNQREAINRTVYAFLLLEYCGILIFFDS